MKESPYKRAYSNLIATANTFKFSYVHFIFCAVIFFIIELLQLIIFLLPIKILIFFISKDIKDFTKDFMIGDNIVLNMEILLYSYLLLVVSSLILRYFFHFLVSNGGKKIAYLALEKDIEIPGAAWWYNGAKITTPSPRLPGWGLNQKKLSMVNKRFGVTNTFIGNLLLVTLVLILVFFLSSPIFLALLSLMIANYFILWNLQFLKNYVHPEGVWPTVSFIKLYLKFSETIMFVLIFLVAIMTISNVGTFEIYMTIIAIFFSRRVINAGTQIINCLLSTVTYLSTYEKDIIKLKYDE